MLTKAIIERLNTAEDNHFKVYVPLLQKANNPREDAILSATLAYIPGFTDYLKVGDIVFVSFEDNRSDKAVILGKLFLTSDKDSEILTNLKTRTFTSSDNTQLPINTTIGGINLATVVDDINGILDNKHIDGKNVIYDNKLLDKLAATDMQEAVDELIIKTLPNYNLILGYAVGYGTQANKFLSINYSNYTSEKAAYFKMSAASCHGNGISYQFLEDIIIGCNMQGSVTCKVIKYAQQPAAESYSTNYYGDIFYIIDDVNKIVDFYILCGQYSQSYYTPFIKIGNTTTSGITQYTSTPSVYSSGTKIWADGNSVLIAVQDQYKTGEEQEIGTWVDGKKLYRRAFRWTGTLSSNSEIEVGDIGSALGDVIDIKQTATYAPTGVTTPSAWDMYYGAGGGHSIIGCRVNLTTGKVYAQACNDNWPNTILIIIVEYTKA